MSRRGFSLVEVMVSMTLIAVALSALVGPTYQFAQRSTALGAATQRAAIVAEQVHRLSVLPFDSLPSRAGCLGASNAALPHVRCVTVTAVTATRLQVAVVVTPANPAFRPDSVVFDRVRAAASNPFSTP